MQSQWNDQEASAYNDHPLNMRVYTSRLLGREPSLVLHGGGNTSVKTKVKNLFGEEVDVLYVKGSGWDLSTIEPAGFAPVRMDVLHRLAQFEKLSDTDMVREQKSAMLNPDAPNPSVEAILHAIIPFKFVDHTHADAVVALTNTPKGETLVRKLYGNKVLYVPYVMPGFVLARKIFELTRDIDWSQIEGMILLHHGVFTFSDDPRESYERMINLVSAAEKLHAPIKTSVQPKALDVIEIAKIRREVSKTAGNPLICVLNDSAEACEFSSLPNIKSLATRGTLTPDHVIHTKPKPLVLGENHENGIKKFIQDYEAYFERHRTEGLKILNPAPKWAIWPGVGFIGFGQNAKSAQIVSDIVKHTARAIMWSENFGGWQPLEESKLFEVEYWELEQAKVRKKTINPPLQGKIALVTGAASGIGKASVEKLISDGAVVAALDIDSKITTVFKNPSVLPIVCDVTNASAVQEAIKQIVKTFGGLDILVSNAGVFSQGRTIVDLPNDDWDRSLAVNLTSHQRLIKLAAPYLALGFEPSIIIIASKNVPAPGPGASAYSVAKAGLTQLARVAALELAKDGIRVNVLHPDAVFDTGIWTEEVLKTRAQHYGMTVEQYKRKNLLKTEVTSKDVAHMVGILAGNGFLKTTGAQIPVDGGNDRVI